MVSAETLQLSMGGKGIAGNGTDNTILTLTLLGNIKIKAELAAYKRHKHYRRPKLWHSCRCAHESTTHQGHHSTRQENSLLTTAIVALSVFVATPPSVLAVDAVWLSTLVSIGNWNTGGNWSTSPSAPVNPGDTATFITSSQTSLFFSASATVESITFKAEANALGPLLSLCAHRKAFGLRRPGQRPEGSKAISYH
jgi:hypothetical protein